MVVSVTDCYMSKTTPEGAKLYARNRAKFAQFYHEGRAEKLGLVVRREAAVVLAQTPERFFQLSQMYRRFDAERRIEWEEATEFEGPIDHFRGRQKMFGDLSPENVK